MDDQIEHYISECSTHFQGYIRREIAKLFAGKTQEKEEPIGGLVTSSVDSLTHADEADAEAELSNERSSETYKKKLLRLQQRFGYKIAAEVRFSSVRTIAREYSIDTCRTRIYHRTPLHLLGSLPQLDQQDRCR